MLAMMLACWEGWQTHTPVNVSGGGQELRTTYPAKSVAYTLAVD